MGQKTNPNIFRLGVNKKWKTEFFEKKPKEFARLSFLDLEIQLYLERFLNMYGLILHDYKVHYSNSIVSIYISYALIVDSKFNKQNKKIILTNNQKKLNLGNRQITKTTDSFFFKMKQYLEQKSFVLDSKFDKNSSLKNPFLDSTDNFTSFSDKNFELENKIKCLIEGLKLFRNNKIIINFKCINKDFNLTLKQKKSLKKKIMLLQKFRYTPFFKEGINLLFLTVYKNNTSQLLTNFISIQLKKIKRQKFFMTFLKKTLTLFVNSNFSKVKGIKIKIKGRLNGVPRAKHKIINIGDIPVQTINSILSYSESTIHNSSGSYGIKVWVVEKIY
jgi:ribosomal protein S3